MIQWSLLNVIIQGIAGFVGAHAAATAVHDHKFGFIGHSLAGLVAGLLSGCFLQVTAMTVVTGSGSENPVSIPEIVAIQLLCGAGFGAIAMVAVGFINKKLALDEPSASPIKACAIYRDCRRLCVVRVPPAGCDRG